MRAVRVLLLIGFAIFFNLWFQEISIPAPRKDTGNSEGKGSFPEGRGGDQIKQMLCRRGLATFWNNTMLVRFPSYS